MKNYLFLCLIFLFSVTITSQSLNLSRLNRSYTIDNISDFQNSITIISLTDLAVEGFGAGTNWDLTMIGALTEVVPYVSQGNPLSQEDIYFRAVNTCNSADQTSALGGTATNNIVATPDGLGPNPQDFKNLGAITWDAGLTNLPYYIVGSENVDGDIFTNGASPCGAGTLINEDGAANTDPTTHNFRIDCRIDLSDFAAGTPIDPGLYKFQVMFQLWVDGALAPLFQPSFDLEIDILPILQLKSTTLQDIIDFNFTDISKYVGGITHTNKTILEASSNVNWDLIAIGTSVTHQADASKPYWDANAQYTSSGNTEIPLTSLELLQSPGNPCVGALDYSTAFVTPPTQINNNNISVLSGILSFVDDNVATGSTPIKCIAGVLDPANVNVAEHFVTPGSYFLSGNQNYRYAITYRLSPGLPTTFPNGKPEVTEETRSGYYSMQVKYIITESQ
tara:strand:+ start:2389 stop:3735 length:1347 start_codon:yes stop_codon:yes gene_type:complete